MAVKIGSARIDENGKAHGGAAGDQTGKEVSTQSWYLHAKGWRVFRAKDPAKAEQIAKTMQRACDNKHIGYDQYQRNTLYTQAEKVGFDVSKVKTNCETDCSALVRVCCASAGIMGLPSDFRTGNMPTNLMKTGQFTEMVGDKYQKKSEYLRRGDVLVTKTNGHTVVVLSNGSKAEAVTPVDPEPAKVYKLGERVLKLTSPYAEGDDVKDLQTRLNKLGFDCGEADGEFGPKTEKGVKAFQTANGLTANGEFDAKALALLNGESPAKTETVYKVQQGDTLWAISAKFLGKGDYYKRIMEANGMTSTTIRPGMKLKIPT